MPLWTWISTSTRWPKLRAQCQAAQTAVASQGWAAPKSGAWPEEPSTVANIMWTSWWRGRGQATSPLGAKSSRLSHREDVPERIAELLGFHQTGWFQSRQPRAGGSEFGAAHGSAVSRWAPSLQGGPSDCQLRWVKRIPGALRALRAWQKLCPWRSRVPYPLAIWTGLASLMIGMGFSDVAIFTMIALSICPTIRIPEDEGLQLGAASDRLDCQLESPDLPRRARRTVEDWRVRCESPVRLSLFEFLDVKSPPSLQGTGQNLWQFNYSQYLSVFKKCASQLGLEACPAQWPVNRSGEASPVTAGGSEAGSMEVNQECSHVRKGSPTGMQLGVGEPEGKNYCLSCESDFAGIVLGHKKPPSTTCLAGTLRAST